MMNEKEFLESQKDCASMLGMTLKEYETFCKNTKISPRVKQQSNQKKKYDNSILKKLGLKVSDLKMKEI